MVALDYDAELKTATDSSHTDTRKYKLPTGHHISVKEESLKCPELLFLPTHWEEMKIEDGIAQYTFGAIMKCEQDIKRDLFRNIVLAGGCTMFKGMQARMKKEI